MLPCLTERVTCCEGPVRSTADTCGGQSAGSRAAGHTGCALGQLGGQRGLPHMARAAKGQPRGAPSGHGGRSGCVGLHGRRCGVGAGTGPDCGVGAGTSPLCLRGCGAADTWLQALRHGQSASRPPQHLRPPHGGLFARATPDAAFLGIRGPAPVSTL